MSDQKPLDVYWFIPVSGDGSYLGSDRGNRSADFSYLKQIAQAADRLGFGGALIPVGSHCEDPWIVAAALATHTERLKLLAALRPGLGRPLTLRAKPLRSTASATAASSSTWSPEATRRSSPATASSIRTTSATRMPPSS